MMRFSTRNLFNGTRGVLLLAALIAIVAALTFLTDGEIIAQTPPSKPGVDDSGGSTAPPGSDQVPTTPRITATAIVGNVIELRWTSILGAARYELLARVGSNWEQLDEGALTGTTFTHTGLSDGTTYYYSVRAMAADGPLGEWSETVSATASTAPPPTPTATPTERVPPSSRIHVPPRVPNGWSSDPDDRPSTYPDGQPINPDDRPFTYPDGQPINPDDRPLTYPDGRPINQDDQPSTYPDGQPINQDARVQSPRSNSRGGRSELTATPTPTSTPTSTPTLTTTPTLTPTPEPTATPTATASALNAPGLTVEAKVRGVVLSWEAAAGAVRYELMTWWDGAGSWQPLGGDDLTGTMYTHTEVTAGTKYYYSIRAVNAAGKTSRWLSDYPSAVAIGAKAARKAEPTPTATATAPALSAPGMTAKATVRGVALSWEAAAEAVRYELMTWWDGAGGWQSIGGDDLTGTTYTHTDVAAGTKYYYTIRAVNAAMETSGWLQDFPTAIAIAVTEAETSTPTPTPTPTPTATAPALSAPGMTARATEGGVELSWEAIPGAGRYELMTWWDGEGSWQLFGGDELTGTMYMHTDVEAGTKYYYTIRAVNAAGKKGGWLQDFATATALAATGN